MSTAQLVPPTAAPKTPSAFSAAPALVQAKASSFFGPPVAETPFFAPVRPAGVQAKLSIGRADNAFEREADATADRIVSMPAPTARPAAVPAASGLLPAIQSKTEEREKKDIQKKELPAPPLIQLKTEDDDKKLRRKGSETATPAPTAAFESGLTASRSGGQPLAADARQYMEPHFGADFSGVRVHTDAPAVQLTQSVGAQAFAYQNHVYFNAGQYDTGSSGGRHLLAHELTHVVQQGSAVQRQPLAEPAAAVPAVSSAAPAVQRLFGLDVAGTIDGWLGVAPGWRLLTTLIGYNPVTQRNVARSTANLLEGFLTLGGPLGALLFNRLQAEGIIDRAAGWIDAQVAALGISLSYIQGLFGQAWDEMGITLGIEGNLAVARRIFGPPISRMIAFGGRLISQVVAWLKETILRPLSAHARTFRGFPLITVIIGKDPFTDEVVERSPTNLVRGFMLLMDGGEERFAQMQQSGALAKAFAWFNTETTKRNLTWTRIKGVFLAAWDVLTPEAVLHPIDTITTIAGLFSSLASDVVGFAGAALMQMLELIFEAVMGAGGARVLAILKRGRDTFNVIIRDPVAFVGHLVRAGKLGFQQFMAKGLQYLQQGVVGWLLGALEGAGLQLPAQFDLRGVLSLVLQVLGLTYQNIRAKLVRATSEAFVARLEQVFDFLRILVTQGPAAAWQKILEYVGNLRDMVLDGIKAWVMRTVVGQAVVRILSMLNPAGAVIQAIMATYNTVMFFVERINQIAAVMEAYADSIAAIAAGNIGAAANRIEQTMGRMVPVIIGFLARLLGLGGISDTIRGLIDRVRQPVDRALNRVADWVVAQGRRVVGAVVGAGQRVAGAVLDFFGIRTNFTTETGERHSLYFAEQNGRSALIVESTPQHIDAFLSFYENEYGVVANSNKGRQIQQIRVFLRTYDAPERRLEALAPDDPARRPIRTALLAKNVELSGMLRTLLSGNRSVGQLIESYRLEGLTGTYASMPRARTDLLTPDHQPQAAVLQWAARLRVGRRMLFSSSSEMARRAGGSHASGGYAINLYEARHIEGRTYGGKGTGTLNDYIARVTPRLAAEPDEQRKRNIVVDEMKSELDADVTATFQVLGRSGSWTDIDALTDLPTTERQALKVRIAGQIGRGARELRNQPMNSLKAG